MSTSVERLEISVTTPAGILTTPVDIPTGFVPVTAIVPLMRHLGEQAQALEERRATQQGQSISCRKGCAACCRMLVPVSGPEAFALKKFIETWPEENKQALIAKLAATQQRLAESGLLPRLEQLMESAQQMTDDEMEPINRDYYALRLPCPFLEDEMCSIYEHRPAACRELQVTTPAKLCDDMVGNRIRAIPVPLRVGTALSLLWAELSGGPMRFVPLPLALLWAARHAPEGERTWKGTQLLEKALDKVWRFLSQQKVANSK
jgi:Fe-S-cluster containining protein